MPGNFNGMGNVPFATSGWVRHAITAVTAGTPIQITCPSHGFHTGDSVYNEGTTVAAADGLFVITVIDANTYSLNGTTSASSGGAGGYAIDYELQPAFYLPQPGEAASMVTLAPVLQGLANAVPYLYQRVGQYSFYNVYPFGNPSFISSNTAFASSFTLAANGALTAGLWTAPQPVGQVGDYIEVDFGTNELTLVTDPGATLAVSYALGFRFGGSGSYVPFNLSSASWNLLANGSFTSPFWLKTFFFIAGGMTTPANQVFDIALMYKSDHTLSTGQNNLFGQMQCQIRHYRSNV